MKHKHIIRRAVFRWLEPEVQTAMSLKIIRVREAGNFLNSEQKRNLSPSTPVKEPQE